eukprot:1157486-Pelagomonas_calceolata.AAC.1
MMTRCDIQCKLRWLSSVVLHANWSLLLDELHEKSSTVNVTELVIAQKNAHPATSGLLKQECSASLNFRQEFSQAPFLRKVPFSLVLFSGSRPVPLLPGLMPLPARNIRQPRCGYLRICTLPQPGKRPPPCPQRHRAPFGAPYAPHGSPIL